MRETFKYSLVRVELMSQTQSIKEMLASWEQSRKSPSSTPLPERFYDVRKRPTGQPRYSVGGMTPMGEALRAKELGLDMRKAKPMEKYE
tara:strand:+ start:1040 stop:1306 length:267 start_codon:yes stop_codon:yes gene_type:complete